jgi:hypothetical protein
MDSVITAALIGAIVALVGWGVAGAVAVYQVTKQARSALKVDLYKEVLSAVANQGEAERELSTKLRILNSLFGVWLSPEQFGGLRPAPNTTWAELNELVYKCQGQGADLMILIERWQIVDPRLDLFRMAFGVALRDIREAWQPVSELASAVVPPIAGAAPPELPPKETLQRLKASNEGVINAASKLSAWVADFQLEVQAVLLSDLFPNRLSHRQPIDPEYFVIRLDRFDALKDYFENKTPWGLEMRVINEQTRRLVAQRQLG